MLFRSPHLIYIGQKWERLSGTDKCPFRKSRHYSCYDCKYIGGELLRNCYCPEKINTYYKDWKPDIETEDWGRDVPILKNVSGQIIINVNRTDILLGKER